jgi:hypothetical protein
MKQVKNLKIVLKRMKKIDIITNLINKKMVLINLQIIKKPVNTQRISIIVIRIASLSLPTIIMITNKAKTLKFKSKLLILCK